MADFIFLKGINKPFSYTISNCLGQQLVSGRTSTNSIENLEKLPSGIYLLNIQVGNELKSYKIIK